MSLRRRAIFLDRDGVINHNVYYEDTKEWESPRTVDDFEIIPEALEAMSLLQKAGYLLFIVSNQPSYAKGKTTLESLQKIHDHLISELNKNAIHLTDAFYCFHHPEGLVPEYSFQCECRKPLPYFLLQAAKKYKIDLASSWMVGDRDSDLACGEAAGVKCLSVLPVDVQCEKSKITSKSQHQNLLEAALKEIIF